jgi:hypothetical protein
MAESKEKEAQTMCHRKVKIEKEEPPQMVDMNRMDYFQIYREFGLDQIQQ